jgi:hypothetical protein
MDRVLTPALCGLLAVVVGGCAHMNDLSPCTGGCCQGVGRLFSNLLVPPCDTCPVGACLDCGGEPCTCAAPVSEGCAAPVDKSCAAPASSCTSCGGQAGSCDSCSAPLLSICRPNLLHALFGCTGCDDEYYWSEWFSDPPQCCDKCDDQGNWTGYCDGCGTHPGEPLMGPVEEIAGCPNCGKVH